MKFYVGEIKLKVRRKKGTINLRPFLTEIINKSGIRNGHMIIQALHSTAGLIGQEDEKGILQKDLPELLDRLVPKSVKYDHDNFANRHPRVGPGERKNGKAHLEYLLIGHHSLALTVQDYKVELGDWPSVLLIDFDPTSRKSRKVKVSIMGE